MKTQRAKFGKLIVQGKENKTVVVKQIVPIFEIY